MEKSSRVLSLGNWPTRPPAHSNYQLSPITKRIIDQVRVEVSQIIPITFQCFLRKLPKASQNAEQLEQYSQEVERRKRQVGILEGIRTSYILGKDYGRTSRKQSQREPKQRVKSRAKSREYESQLKLQSVQSRSKISRHLSRISSQKENQSAKKGRIKQSRQLPECSPPRAREQSDYFVPFDPRKKSCRKQSNIREEESTKSQPGRSKAKRSEEGEYGFFLYKGHSKIRQRKESPGGRVLEQSKQICGELLKTVEDWENLDRRHVKELTQMSSLSSRERDRLCKMHSLEKKAMGVRMRSIKSRLKSEGGV